METKNLEERIQISSIDQVKFVSKPWGWEKWIADGRPMFPYALKEIFIRAPYKSSLQFHKYKQETNYIQKGRCILHYSDNPIDADMFTDGAYSPEQIREFIDGIRKVELGPGRIFHIFPGFLHRVEAVEDLLMVETSTVELDDVFRVQDDLGRSHGRIESEHR